jgi:hypothetical protein
MACRELPTDQRGDDEPVGLLGVEASRRRFLRRAATGAVAVGASGVLIAGLPSAAGAQTAGTTPGSSPGTTPEGSTPPASTKTVPAKIEGNDLTIGIFVSSLELAAISLYDALLDNGKLAPSAAQAARTYQMHHKEHSTQLATFTGSGAPTDPNPKLVAEMQPQIERATTETELAGIGGRLEERLAATYQWAMAQIDAWQFATLVATIVPVDAQQAVAWSQVVEPDLDKWFTTISTTVPPTQTDAGRFDPAAYPVAGA